MADQLPIKAEYNDLNGEEVFELLHTRLYDFLKTIPGLERRFALTRCILRLEVAFDIWGQTPPKKVYHHKYELTANPPAVEGEPIEEHGQADIEIDSRNGSPDEIREEHGLPLPEGRMGQHGFRETALNYSDEKPKYSRPPQPRPASMNPANQPNPNFNGLNAGPENAAIVPRGGKKPYAAVVVQDYQGSVNSGSRNGGEGPVVGAEKIAEAGSAAGTDHAPVQTDFRLADNRGIDQSKGKAIFQSAIEKGRQVDQTLAENERVARMQNEHNQRANQRPKPRGRQ